MNSLNCFSEKIRLSETISTFFRLKSSYNFVLLRIAFFGENADAIEKREMRTTSARSIFMLITGGSKRNVSERNVVIVKGIYESIQSST